jgi:hypothetical protein
MALAAHKQVHLLNLRQQNNTLGLSLLLQIASQCMPVELWQVVLALCLQHG